MINEHWLCRVDFSRRASSRAAPAGQDTLRSPRLPPAPPAPPGSPRAPLVFPEMTPTRQAPHMEKVKYKLLLKEASLSGVS